MLSDSVNQNPDGSGYDTTKEVAVTSDEPTLLERFDHLVRGRRRHHQVILNVGLGRRYAVPRHVAANEVEVLTLTPGWLIFSVGCIPSKLVKDDGDALGGTLNDQPGSIREPQLEVVRNDA